MPQVNSQPSQKSQKVGTQTSVDASDMEFIRDFQTQSPKMFETKWRDIENPNPVVDFYIEKSQIANIHESKNRKLAFENSGFIFFHFYKCYKMGYNVNNEYQDPMLFFETLYKKLALQLTTSTYPLDFIKKNLIDIENYIRIIKVKFVMPNRKIEKNDLNKYMAKIESVRTYILNARHTKSQKLERIMETLRINYTESEFRNQVSLFLKKYKAVKEKDLVPFKEFTSHENFFSVEVDSLLVHNKIKSPTSIINSQNTPPSLEEKSQKLSDVFDKRYKAEITKKSGGVRTIAKPSYTPTIPVIAKDFIINILKRGDLSFTIKNIQNIRGNVNNAYWHYKPVFNDEVGAKKKEISYLKRLKEQKPLVVRYSELESRIIEEWATEHGTANFPNMLKRHREVFHCTRTIESIKSKWSRIKAAKKKRDNQERVNSVNPSKMKKLDEFLKK
eukprot:GAHX01000376.1.p1 GENE.GAHX01000376.1~~GAHX01000376.1.p1  ORF type:complete len:445 (-),score=94.12 GAHX01000376.1:1109-2443(-)